MNITPEGLVAPSMYLALRPDRKAAICNGAGPKRFGWLVPDTLYGLSITEAANIHDFMYARGLSKVAADEIFYENMCTIVRNRGGIFMYLRLIRAWEYYKAVDTFGGFFHKE